MGATGGSIGALPGTDAPPIRPTDFEAHLDGFRELGVEEPEAWMAVDGDGWTW